VITQHERICAHKVSTCPTLSHTIRTTTHASFLNSYVSEVAANASTDGQPTMRPLSYEFPNDPKAFGHNDEYMFGDRLLVAPVTLQNATSRSVSVC
jgi:alpha-glucosidase (family GH31 glycosyl hydrolase)